MSSNKVTKDKEKKSKDKSKNKSNGKLGKHLSAPKKKGSDDSGVPKERRVRDLLVHSNYTLINFIFFFCCC